MKGCSYTITAALAASIVNAAPSLKLRGPNPEIEQGGIGKDVIDILPSDRNPRDSDSVTSGGQVAVFWGQSTEELSDVCADDNFDIIIMAFVTSLNPPKLNLGKDTGSASTAQAAKDGWSLFDGTLSGANGKSVAEQIQGCQSAGKKVMISFGGTDTVSNATFSSSKDAKQAADYLWQLFLGGTDMSDLRPFGSDVTLDGVDMDNETGDGSFYEDFVAQLKSYFNGASQTYYLSADPVCGAVGDGNNTSIPESIMPSIDFLNIQFYNNDKQEIGADGFENNIKQWDSLLSGVSPSPKLFVGIPGGEGAAQDGVDIQTADQISKTIAGIKDMNLANFGGMMIWDAGYAMNNTGFPAAVKGAL